MPTPVLSWTRLSRRVAETLPPTSVGPPNPPVGAASGDETIGPSTASFLDRTPRIPTPQRRTPPAVMLVRFTRSSSPPDSVMPQPRLPLTRLLTRVNRNPVLPVIWLR